MSIFATPEWEEMSIKFNEAMKVIEADQEKFWESLSEEDRLKVFCAVSRRIYKGEIEDKRSYRGVLYDVFKFGPEAYAQAQVAGYLSIHNSIFDSMNDDLEFTLRKFVHKFGLDVTDEQINEFVIGQVL